MSPLYSRILRGAGTAAVQQFVNLIIQLLSVPLFLWAWGVNLYGEWILLSAVPIYLSLSDFGFSTASCNLMAMRFARNEIDGARRAYSAALTLLVLLACVFATLLVSSVALLPINDVFGLTLLSRTQAGVVLGALGLSVLLGMVRANFYSIYYADGRYPQGTLLLTLCKLIEFVAPAGAALLGGGPQAAALALLGGAAVSTALYGCYAVASSPWIHGLSLGWDRKELGELLAPSLAFLIFPLAFALNMQGLVLVIGLAMSPAAAASFSTMRTLSRLGMMLLRSIGEMVRPEMSRAFGLGDAGLFQRLIENLTRVSVWGGLLLMIGLIFVGPRLLALWTNGKMAAEPVVLMLLVLGAYVQALTYPAYAALYAANHHKRLAVIFLVVNGLLLTTAYLFRESGLAAAAGLAMVTEVIQLFVVMLLVKRLIETQIGPFLLNCLRLPVPEALIVCRFIKRRLVGTDR